jgi:hypothetical protein
MFFNPQQHAAHYNIDTTTATGFLCLISFSDAARLFCPSSVHAPLILSVSGRMVELDSLDAGHRTELQNGRKSIVAAAGA